MKQTLSIQLGVCHRTDHRDVEKRPAPSEHVRARASRREARQRLFLALCLLALVGALWLFYARFGFMESRFFFTFFAAKGLGF